MYAKVFASLWDGSLRGQPEKQLVFIYLLAHADEDGAVQVIQSKIADDTGLEYDAVCKAIAELEAPDDDSRSLDCDGRALEPMQGRSWGWQIVNHKKYRDLRHAIDRTMQNREAKRRSRVSASVSIGQHRSAMSAHTDTDTDTDTDTESTHLLKTNGKDTLKTDWIGTFHEHFWPAYPRRVAKEQALKAWMQLLPPKALLGTLEVLAGEIMDGLALYQRTEWDGKERDKIPYPATWLRARRFTDVRETQNS